MAPSDVQAAGTAAGWHLETRKVDRTTVQVHKETREQLTAIRESINGMAGADVVTNDDVVRLALLTLGTLEGTTQGDGAEIAEETADVIVPLMEHVRAAADPAVLSGESRRVDGTGGED